jgi:hypothetical protein
MTYGSEGGENVRFKHKKPIFVLKFKIYIYIYVGLMFFHFKDHL